MIAASTRPRSQKSLRSRSGFALPVAILGMALLGAIIASSWTVVEINAASTGDREEAARALQIAEAGAAHAYSLLRGPLRDTTFTRLLRGSDGLPATADDGVLDGFALPSGAGIPAGGISFGGGLYTARVIDDPADGNGNPLLDSNNRVLIRCTGTTARGASATINLVVSITSLPALATNGELQMGGSTQVLGPCGGVHSNGTFKVNSTIVVDQGVKTAANAQIAGQGGVVSSSGVAMPIETYQPPVVIPEQSHTEWCAGADFTLQSNGHLRVNATGLTFNATTTTVQGWRRVSSTPVVWELAGNTTVPGTYCVQGNARISGNPGHDLGAPLPLTVVASGSVEVSGTPKITTAHPGGALIVAQGDVVMTGNAAAGDEIYHGLIYAGSQCAIEGNPVINGQIMCRDAPNPSGSLNLASANTVTGNPVINFNCTGMFSRRTMHSWYQGIGQ